MSLLVDNPILNSPFEELERYWAYEEGQPVLKEGRRPAGYYLKARTRGPQAVLLEEEFVLLELVNAIREREFRNSPEFRRIPRIPGTPYIILFFGPRQFSEEGHRSLVAYPVGQKPRRKGRPGGNKYGVPEFSMVSLNFLRLCT